MGLGLCRGKFDCSVNKLAQSWAAAWQGRRRARPLRVAHRWLRFPATRSLLIAGPALEGPAQRGPLQPRILQFVHFRFLHMGQLFKGARLAVDIVVDGGGQQLHALVHELGAVRPQVRPQLRHVRPPEDVPHRARAAVPATNANQLVACVRRLEALGRSCLGKRARALHAGGSSSAMSLDIDGHSVAQCHDSKYNRRR